MTLDERLTRTVHHVADTVSVPEVDVAAIRRTARAHQRRTLAMAAVVGVLVAAASISVAPRLVDHALQPAWRPVQGHGRVPADWVGVWVDTLPSGPVAQAAWVDGDTLHVGSHTVPITGRGIGASSGLVVHAATRTGWFASLTTPQGGRFGVIHPDGTFVEFQKYGKDGPLLVSPDGSQALLGGDNRGFLIDTATGRILMREPAHIGAIAWGNDGIYAGTDAHGGPVMWKPGIGITKSSFDAHRCHSSYTGTGPIRANLLAGYSGCTVPRLASMSPDGTHALVTGEQKFGTTFSSYVLDLRSGRKIQLVPQKQLEGPGPLFRPYWTSPSYAVLWEDNEHALIELPTPTEPATAAPGTRVQDSSVIVRCNVETGSCERASDPFSADGIGLAPLP